MSKALAISSVTARAEVSACLSFGKEYFDRLNPFNHVFKNMEQFVDISFLNLMSCQEANIQNFI